MTGGTETPGRWSEDALDFVVAAITARAADAGLGVAESPGLVGDAFNGSRGEPSASVDANDLPSVRRGLAIGRHPVVLGLLPETTDEHVVAAAIRRHRNQCVIARSTLAPNAALDLVLVLVGPRGSEGKDPWRAVALMVERDDRVARKLVWLRPDDPADDRASFDGFTRRTFLAHPWRTAARFSVAKLDDIAADLDAGVPPSDTAGTWTKLAVERGAEPDSLVDGLVEAWKRRSAQ